MAYLRDKGAHFHRCDFQVHTPRDRRWNGKGAVTSQEREEYAKELIVACREKGVDAIAITDHHDFAFFPHVRDAAKSEKDWLDLELPPEKQIVVFPGLELTLTTPTCQALLILDADFPDNLLQSVLTVLALSPAPVEDSHAAEVQRIPSEVVTGLPKLYEKLSQYDHIRGRFIVLPNVSEGGNRTLLRSGFAGYYKSMPCVGGYVDGCISKLGAGNRAILQGRTPDYGSKSIAVFQTSDNRRRDHSDLGAASTWVKWATPTAEALRQACLAADSRISQETPQLPAVVIRSIHVSNSGFLGPFDLHFNSQYTALIGSRGTGKSSILEYLRWGLCDEESIADSDSLGTETVESRQQRLVENTLKKYSAMVEVRFEVNGVPHLIRRRSGTGEILLKIGEGDIQPCTKDEVRSLLPIEAYSQKQLSRVGHRVSDLNRFVQSGIKTELDSIDGDIVTVISQSRQVYSRLQRKRTLEKSLREDRLAVESLSQQATTIRESLKGLSSEQQQLISRQPQYLAADLQVQRWDGEFKKIGLAIVDLSAQLANIPSLPKVGLEEHPQKTALEDIRGHIKSQAEILARLCSKMEGVFRESVDVDGKAVDPYKGLLEKWFSAKRAFDEDYQVAKAAASSHASQLNSLADIEQKIKVISERMDGTESQIFGMAGPELEFGALRDSWKELHRRRGELYATQCQKLTELSGGVIRAHTRRGGNVAALDAQIRAITKGSGLRGQKIDDLLGGIRTCDDPVALWDLVLDELDALAHFRPGELSSQLPESVTIRSYGFNDGDIGKLAEKVSPENWLELALTSLQDETSFEYQTKEQEYIPFENASAGQQATALLITLLNQSGPPLIIDQPEDDLDNQVISDIVRRVWKAKTRRQLIFSSHNANLVVNGDAELVVWCDYRNAGDYSGGRVAGEGAIDMPIIRETIKMIMEGGEKAFKLRLDKYGF